MGGCRTSQSGSVEACGREYIAEEEADHIARDTKNQENEGLRLLVGESAGLWSLLSDVLAMTRIDTPRDHVLDPSKLPCKTRSHKASLDTNHTHNLQVILAISHSSTNRAVLGCRLKYQYVKAPSRAPACIINAPSIGILIIICVEHSKYLDSPRW